jgi:hypothetical protein
MLVSDDAPSADLPESDGQPKPDAWILPKLVGGSAT